MNYQKAISDVNSLVGKTLESINPGANIMVEDVDFENERILIKNSKGKNNSRPFTEIKKVWEALLSGKPVHVDSVLAGSGSSRNQPETIIANLPYVEWLKISGKKHLLLVNRITHRIGTLKEMDQMEVEELKLKLSKSFGSWNKSKVMIISNNLNKIHQVLKTYVSNDPKTYEPGIYYYEIQDLKIILIDNNKVDPQISPGTYIVLSSFSHDRSGKQVHIAGNSYSLLDHDQIKILIEN